MAVEPNVTYGNIVADPRARSSEVTENNNDAVVYSELQTTGAPAHSVAPSGDLYANDINVSR